MSLQRQNSKSLEETKLPEKIETVEVQTKESKSTRKRTKKKVVLNVGRYDLRDSLTEKLFPPNVAIEIRDSDVSSWVLAHIKNGCLKEI